MNIEERTLAGIRVFMGPIHASLMMFGMKRPTKFEAFIATRRLTDFMLVICNMSWPKATIWDSNHAVSSFLNTSTLGSGPSYKVESEVDAPKSEKHSYEGK